MMKGRQNKALEKKCGPKVQIQPGRIQVEGDLLYLSILHHSKFFCYSQDSAAVSYLPAFGLCSHVTSDVIKLGRHIHLQPRVLVYSSQVQ